MILKKPSKSSAINVRVQGQEDDKNLDGENVWTDFKKGKITNWKEICRSKDE
jgi:hypothetical protein